MQYFCAPFMFWSPYLVQNMKSCSISVFSSCDGGCDMKICRICCVRISKMKLITRGKKKRAFLILGSSSYFWCFLCLKHLIILFFPLFWCLHLLKHLIIQFLHFTLTLFCLKSTFLYTRSVYFKITIWYLFYFKFCAETGDHYLIKKIWSFFRARLHFGVGMWKGEGIKLGFCLGFCSHLLAVIQPSRP